MRKIMWQLYNRMERFLIPGLVEPQFAYRDVLRSHIKSNTRWLDLGCGYKLFSKYLPDSEQSQNELVQLAELVVGIDADSEVVKKNRKIPFKAVGDIEKLPFKDNSFNLVTANMVVEHVSNPQVLLSEINRILVVGGHFIFHTPNTLNYKIMLARPVPEFIKKSAIKYLQNRGADDVFPTYYRLNRSKVIKEAAEIAGFDLKELNFLQGPADSVMLGPLVIFELLLMKGLNNNSMSGLRSNIIAVLEKVRV